MLPKPTRQAMTHNRGPYKALRNCSDMRWRSTSGEAWWHPNVDGSMLITVQYWHQTHAWDDATRCKKKLHFKGCYTTPVKQTLNICPGNDAIPQGKPTLKHCFSGTVLVWSVHVINQSFPLTNPGYSMQKKLFTSSSRASRWRKFQKKKELYSKERICL